MKDKKRLFKRELVKLTGAPPYTIDYLYRCNRLPIIKESGGAGYPVIFHPDCIEIVKKHLNKR
ncbi:hypothetical protein ACFL5D_04380 [Candidatus Neomarinimicrobiota bacterium]